MLAVVNNIYMYITFKVDVIDIFQMESLPAPYGDCVTNGTLKYPTYKTYSREACRREQQTDTLVKACSCRDVYMPGFNDSNISIYLYLKVFVNICIK